MKHVTQKLIEVNGTPVDIKARLEKGAWVVIAFTPVFSIRSHKLHLPKARDNFITAIVSAAMDEDDPEYADNRDAIQRRRKVKLNASYDEVNATLLLVTGNFNVE